MSIMKRIFGEEKRIDEDKYIDLSEWLEEERKGEQEPANMYVHVAEIYRYEDLSDLTGYVYDNNILLIDYGPIAGDDLTLKRITNELKQLAHDVNGDTANIGKNIIMVTPTGVRIDRRKIRGTY